MSKHKYSPIPVRVPDYLRDWLEQKAEYYHRSLSSEIAYRIEEDYREEQKREQTSEGVTAVKPASAGTGA